jgi:hypothetical protein
MKQCLKCKDDCKCSFLQAFANSIYCNRASKKSVIDVCVLKKPYTYTPSEQNIFFGSNRTASTYPILFNVTGPCHEVPKDVSLFIKNLTCTDFLNVGIVLVNPQNFGVALFYNPDAVLTSQQKLIGSQTFQGPNTSSNPRLGTIPSGAPPAKEVKQATFTITNLQSNLPKWVGQSGTFIPNVANSIPRFSSPCPNVSSTSTLDDFSKYTGNGTWKLYIENFGTGLGYFDLVQLSLYF